MDGWTKAARGFDGSKTGAGAEGIGRGRPCTDGGAEVEAPRPYIGGADGLAIGGIGVGAPGPPIFWRRDFRSIFGFLSSGIVRPATLRAPTQECQRDGKVHVGHEMAGKGSRLRHGG